MNAPRSLLLAAALEVLPWPLLPASDDFAAIAADPEDAAGAVGEASGGGQDVGAVKVLRCANRNDVHAGMGKRFVEVVVGGNILHTRLGDAFAGAVERTAGHGEDLRVRIVFEGRDMLGRNPARAVNEDAEFLHREGHFNLSGFTVRFRYATGPWSPWRRSGPAADSG